MVNEQQTTLSTDDHSLGWALCFEVSLGLIALLCGYATDVWPAEKLAWPPSISTVILGLLTALPPLFLMLGVRRLPLRVVRDLTRIVDQKVGPMFKGLRVGELAMLSLAAGWGEELLFRGLIQAEIASSGGIVVGILVASVVFALVHFISIAYFIMAFVMSIYFGWLFWQTESLWVPVLAHAGYDFLMLLWMRWFADTSDLDGDDLDGGDSGGGDSGGGDSSGGDSSGGDLSERELEASGSDTRGSDAGDSVGSQSESSDERQNSNSAVDP